MEGAVVGVALVEVGVALVGVGVGVVLMKGWHSSDRTLSQGSSCPID